jgi:hypothetical protein
VDENFQVPDISTQGATITCSEQLVTISANSETPGVSYLWSDGGLYGDPATPEITAFINGDYTVTVTDPANGCSNTATVSVGLNNTEPDLLASASGVLTCSNTTVTLTASSITPGVIFSWAGFTGDNPVTVNNPGIYPVTAKNPVNGCSTSKNVTVLQDTLKPNVSVSASGTLLTCSVTSVTLTASTSTPDATLTWTGFATGVNPINISAPGTYYVTAHRSGNGCDKTDSIVVIQNIQVPDLIATGATITCAEQLVTISASSTAPVTYLWSDGGLFDDPTSSELLAFIDGDYSVTVTNTENGCTNSATVTVGLDNVSPVCTIIGTESPIALANNTVTAQKTTGASYAWSVSATPGWNAVSGNTTSEFTYHAGDVGTSATLNLTVTSPNGCEPSVCQLALTAVSALKEASIFAANTITPVEDIQISVYPNPFVDKAFVEFTPADSSVVIVELYSANGTLQEKLFDEEVQASQQYKIAVDAKKMRPGLYYVVVKTNGKVYTQKLVLVN